MNAPIASDFAVGIYMTYEGKRIIAGDNSAARESWQKTTTNLRSERKLYMVL